MCPSLSRLCRATDIWAWRAPNHARRLRGCVLLAPHQPVYALQVAAPRLFREDVCSCGRVHRHACAWLRGGRQRLHGSVSAHGMWLAPALGGAHAERRSFASLAMLCASVGGQCTAACLAWLQVPFAYYDATPPNFSGRADGGKLSTRNDRSHRCVLSSCVRAVLPQPCLLRDRCTPTTVHGFTTTTPR